MMWMTLNRCENKKNVIIAILKSELGLRILISSLPDSASRLHVESLDKPLDSTCVLEA